MTGITDLSGYSKSCKIPGKPINHILHKTLQQTEENECPGYPVNVTLIKEDEEDNVVPEAADPVHGRHLDHEGKDVIDESVERFVGQHAPGQVSHGLQLVVDEKLRCHHDET